MLIYYLVDARLISYFLYPVPVDFRILRLLILCEIMEWPTAPYGNLYDDKGIFCDMARRLSMTYCRRYGVHPNELCDALWLFPGVMCRYNPGNLSNTNHTPSGRRRIVEAQSVNWGIPHRVAAYLRSCG